MSHLRRFFFALFVFGLALLLFGVIRSTRPGYGLFDLIRGKAPPSEAFTTPTAPKLSATDVAGLAQLDDEFAKVADAVLPSVVRINTSSLRQHIVPFGPFTFQGPVEEAKGLGSGAIISKEGHIVTNYHVIEGAQQVEVTTNDKKTFKARVLGVAEHRDVALLKIESNRRDFPALAWADSDKVRVGQIVFAVGNPFGLNGTVTQGIISARDRLVSDARLDYLQTDTVINPGNSGGPLVNIRGEIVGINVSIYQANKSVGAWQGVGFSIPGNEAKQIIESLRQLGSTQQDKRRSEGYLGLSLGSISGIKGAFVNLVLNDSPAAVAGLQPGDLIIEFNGEAVESPEQLRDAIRRATPNSVFKMKVARGNDLGEITGKIGSQTF